MHFLTLRIYSKVAGDWVFDQTVMVDHLARLEKVEQTFDVHLPGLEGAADTCTLQLQFDPPLDLTDADDPGPTPE